MSFRNISTNLLYSKKFSRNEILNIFCRYFQLFIDSLIQSTVSIKLVVYIMYPGKFYKSIQDRSYHNRKTFDKYFIVPKKIVECCSEIHFLTFLISQKKNCWKLSIKKGDYFRKICEEASIVLRVLKLSWL